ncbi:MAG: YicC family protein [Flavobacteriales bacterium]|nr:YicC family protein [Flavobacteriales bacterium]MBK9287624.1 YicC family protein [Flavobacteriales bacterium]MBL0037212.1 YicC family protein [Flavobacteriales bacterium]
MLRSMTGFGRAEGVVNDRKVTVEVRSVNSKQLDLFLKVPQMLREKEAELRGMAAEAIVRGKAEVTVNAELMHAEKRTSFDRQLVKAYHDELKSIAAEVDPTATTDLLALVLRMPDVSNTQRDVLSDEEWLSIRALVADALRAFQDFRSNEGQRLHDELAHRVAQVTDQMDQIEVLDVGRTERTRERLRSKLAELQAAVDQDRFEQELVFYLEKLDVTEEKVRLRAHCTYFLETLGAEDAQGRKLGFIGQEMGREINTLGSKANDATIQRCVVLMKDELEKIKEQVLNVL